MNTPKKVGRLTVEQAAVLKSYVKGRYVLDLGGGEGRQAMALINLGAENVTIIDDYRTNFVRHARISVINKPFVEAIMPGEKCDIAFISWPLNRPTPGLIEFMAQAETIVYVGKNTDGVACGWQEFWRYLMKRQLLVESRDHANTLLIYGPNMFDEVQFRCEEELAGIMASGPVQFKMLKYGELIKY